MKISHEDLVRLVAREVTAQLAQSLAQRNGKGNGKGSGVEAIPEPESSANAPSGANVGANAGKGAAASHLTPFGAAEATVFPTPEAVAAEGFPCNVSARHGHLTPEHVETLFGTGTRLTPFKWLYQEGQFASEQRVHIMGPRGSIANVRILGPERSKSQFEISRTDALAIGVMPPILQSVNHGTGAPITIVGPAGSIHLEDALIRAKRHVHLGPDEAQILGVKDGDEVAVELPGSDQGLVLYNTLIRVDPTFHAEMHIDTDEGNAAGIEPGARGFVLSPRSSICRICR